ASGPVRPHVTRPCRPGHPRPPPSLPSAPRPALPPRSFPHMILHLRRAAVACAAVLALAACGESAVDSPGSGSGGSPSGGATTGGDALVFASIPTEESTSLQQSYAPVIAMLERETGTTIEFQNATDYAAVIEGMRAGQIDIAVFGPFSYVLAKRQDPGITPVAAVVDGPGDQPGYRSYAITTPGSGITDLAGFAGRTGSFV